MAVFDKEGNTVDLRKKILEYPKKELHNIMFEAAKNSYEIHTKPAVLPEALTILDEAYDATLRYFNDMLVIGTSQPFSDVPISDFGYFRLYPESAKFYAPTNSIQLNLGVGDQSLILPMYSIMLRLHPFLFAVSQSAIIDKRRRGRAYFLNKAKSTMDRNLYYPKEFRSLEEYYSYLNAMRDLQERDLNRMRDEDFAERYTWEFVRDKSLRFRSFSPKYVFLPDRPRPDKKMLTLNLEGCLETRSLDGTFNRNFDKAFIELSIGLFVANEPKDLTSEDCEKIQSAIEAVPQEGLETLWYINGESRTVRDSIDDQLELAYHGLKSVGHKPIFLDLIQNLKQNTLDEFVLSHIKELDRIQTIEWLSMQF